MPSNHGNDDTLLADIGTTLCPYGCLYLELVDKFCYLGDLLSADGDADAAVETRIRSGWL